MKLKLFLVLIKQIRIVKARGDSLPQEGEKYLAPLESLRMTWFFKSYTLPSQQS